ncbi:MAG: hypothetical protein NVSMB55_26970 [Mycobacteriales bacterium]
MRRVVVVGQSGAGKTTTARRLGAALQVPHVELDALFHGPDWRPRAAFGAEVAAIAAGPGWVVDGNYTGVRDVLWERADTVVWLDLPRASTLRRVVVRTCWRLVSRHELWNGNRERWSTVARASHPIRWTWQTHRQHRVEYEQRLAEPRWAQLQVVRLRTPAEQRRWLHRVSLPTR